MFDSKYANDIARAADLRLSPAQLRRAQQEMWKRHRTANWESADIGQLHAAMIRPDRARLVERMI